MVKKCVALLLCGCLALSAMPAQAVAHRRSPGKVPALESPDRLFDNQAAHRELGISLPAIAAAAKTARLYSPAGIALAAYPRLDMPDGRGYAPERQRAWFMRIVINSLKGGDFALPKLLSADEEAAFGAIIPSWGEPRLAAYPLEPSQCAMGHTIRWGFNYVHPEGRFRVELGQDEVVSLGLLSETRKENLKSQYKEAVRKANESHPALGLVLEHVERLAAMPQFKDEENQRRLAALSAIKAAPPGLIDVMEQKILAQNRLVSLLSSEDLSAYRAALEEAGLMLKPSRGRSTPLQELLREIAVAVQMAGRGDPSGWDRIAESYSRNLEKLSAFSIKVAALFRFAGLARNPPEKGKSLHELKAWGFFGSGPSIGARGLAKLGLLNGKAVHDFDFSEAMLAQGREAVRQTGLATQHSSTRADILAERVNLADKSLDAAETGLMESIAEPEKRLHLLSELNRVLSIGGYLLITFKHGPESPEFLQALEEHLGFTVLDKGSEKLSYDRGLLKRIAKNEPRQAGHLRKQIEEGSLLVAMKVRDVPAAQESGARERLLGLLRHAKPDPAQESTPANARQPAAGEEFAIPDYAPLQQEIHEMLENSPAPDSPADPELYAKIEELALVLPLLPKSTPALGKVQEHAQDLIARWNAHGHARLSQGERRWLETVHSEHVIKNYYREYTWNELDKKLDLTGRVKAFIKGAQEGDEYWTLEGLLSSREKISLYSLILHLKTIRPLPAAAAADEYARRMKRQAHGKEIQLSSLFHEAVTISLRGHLLATNMYASARATRQKALDRLEKLETAGELWSISELLNVREEFLHACLESADFRGNGSFRATALALKLLAAFGRPLGQADVYEALEWDPFAGTALVPEDWSNLLLAVFGPNAAQAAIGATPKNEIEKSRLVLYGLSYFVDELDIFAHRNNELFTQKRLAAWDDPLVTTMSFEDVLVLRYFHDAYVDSGWTFAYKAGDLRKMFPMLEHQLALLSKIRRSSYAISLQHKLIEKGLTIAEVRNFFAVYRNEYMTYHDMASDSQFRYRKLRPETRRLAVLETDLKEMRQESSDADIRRSASRYLRLLRYGIELTDDDLRMIHGDYIATQSPGGTLKRDNPQTLDPSDFLSGG
ncbi:MAG: methyltransferase domain-containing protein [Elusimicrobia bacterium]|nr:methyltransferase domain-containing protein [Elusimicrobiota bacterium]